MVTITINKVGTSLGATKGLLLRGVSILEKFAAVDTVVFYKTGTLTIGKPVVTKILTTISDEFSELQLNSYEKWSDVLKLAVVVESNTIHPIGKWSDNYIGQRGTLWWHAHILWPRATYYGSFLKLDNEHVLVQSLQEVTVNVLIPHGTKSRFVACDIKKNHLKVELKGQHPILKGDFCQEDQNSILILLTKQDQMKWWKCLVKGEHEINTQKIEPKRSKLGDLDPETRSTIEKMMFDQQGKPTSHDNKDKVMEGLKASSF
ncbi:nuclear migration protein nudC [Tanacetum coccineum]